MAYEYYNLSVFTEVNQTGLLTFMQQTAALVNNLPGTVIILSTFIIFFVVLKTKGHSPKNCFAAASWLIAIMALILKPLGLLNNVIFIISLVSLGLAMLLLFLLRE